MKKFIILLSVFFLTLISCKKEKIEPNLPQTLSEYIIGEWTCKRQMVQGHQADLTITFLKNKTYTLYVNFGTAGPSPFTSTNKHYIIYEETNIIKLDYPYSNELYIVEYNIMWDEINQVYMAWNPRPTNEKNITSNFTMLSWSKQ